VRIEKKNSLDTKMGGGVKLFRGRGGGKGVKLLGRFKNGGKKKKEKWRYQRSNPWNWGGKKKKKKKRKRGNAVVFDGEATNKG